MKSIETKTKNINNQTLFKELDKLLLELFSMIGGIAWHDRDHREAIADMANDLLSDLFELGKIIQYDVLCDDRNNTDEDLRLGIVHFVVRYRQKNCFNTTEIAYTIRI
jgi:hypothetical protein